MSSLRCSRAENTADLHEFPWVVMGAAAFASGPAKTNALVKLVD